MLISEPFNFPQAFYGVFDGHGGRAAVDFVSERLGRNVVSAVLVAGTETRGEASSEDGVSAAIRAAYLATDDELLAQHQVHTAYCQSDTTYKDARSFCLPGLLRIYALSSHVEHVKKILICACHVYILVFLDDHAPM